MSKHCLLNRRRALWFSLGTLVGIGTFAGRKEINWSRQIQALNDSKRDFTVVGQASLKERAAAKGLIYGSEGEYRTLSSDAKFATCFVRECSMLVNAELKWYLPSNPLRPSPDRFDFTAGDWLVEFAQLHGLLLRGHTLVWYQSLPPWFEETVNSQNAEQFLVKHIRTVVKRYAGKMHSWDVVNEAVDPTAGRSDGLRKTPWLKFLGPSYIDLAFRLAAEADPQALLVYNDNEMDYDVRENEAKRNAVLKLLERLKSVGTPIHALGIQAHLLGNETYFNPKKMRNFLKDVASLGLKILVTEMDVTDKDLPFNLLVRDRMVAKTYENYLSVVLDEPAVIAVLTWGLSDRYTWLSQFQPRPDNAPVRPLPLDARMNPKLAWNAIARAFNSAPRR
ncbi:MAG: endo-1,4-beta-xylanase [Chroococcidiopsidaceae cyanobacterium CP_BM_ER_R8_30]|nr:endo-1,4-beta-xylanase [Chroococcidiopsidaceae cyanobacterium CP_BM_ER_R8_30]